MSEIAIKVENLGKRYRIGATVGYKTLRESLFGAAKAPFRRQAAADKTSADSKTPYIWALRNASFQIERGQAVGIIGKNGSGKSTLLKILSRITRPTEGCAEIYGRVASLLEVGTGFHPELTGRENINLSAAVMGMKSYEVKNKIDDIIDFAGDTVKNLIDTPVKRYSSGMYVRLAFAIAAHLETDVLLVDEVLAVGDAEFQKKCLNKMDDVAQSGRTVVFVSHNMNAIQRLCSSVYLLDHGCLAAHGNTREIIDEYYKSSGTATAVTEERLVGESETKFLNWHLIDSETKQPHQCFTREPCRFNFKFHSGKDIKQANFGFSLWAGDGELIWAMRSLDFCGRYIQVQKGRCNIEFFVPSLPIKPGVYQLMVSAYESDESLDLWYTQPELTVLPKDESGMPSQWQGIINLPGEFSISEGPTDAL